MAKVYDYKPGQVQESLKTALKKYRSGATVADLVAATGLPKHQVQTELPAVADEYSGRMQVTSSGEILYSFPRGFTSRYRGFAPSMKRTLRAFAKGAGLVAKTLFKFWIMVTLIGYFAIFILLALLAVFASVAMSAAGSKNSSSRSRGRGGDLGGFWLAGRILNLVMRIWFYNEVFKSPAQRQREAQWKVAKKKDRRPLHKAIFSFVFGEDDPNASLALKHKKAFAALVRQKKGIIILEEFMAITGLSPQEAEKAINAYLYEFEGVPEASENGTVYFRFDSLMSRAQDDSVGADDIALASLRKFSVNKKSSNTAYAVINGVNLLFGSYFFISSLSAASILAGPIEGAGVFYAFTYALLEAFVIANPGPLLFYVLGIIPLVFSVLFWLVPAIRALRLKRENKKIREENYRRVLYTHALKHPRGAARPRTVPEAAKTNSPAKEAAILEELAASLDGQPLPDGRVWHLNELVRKLEDISQIRGEIEKYDLGDIEFDTDGDIV